MHRVNGNTVSRLNLLCNAFFLTIIVFNMKSVSIHGSLKRGPRRNKGYVAGPGTILIGDGVMRLYTN
jgi:hypothetical protein